MFVHIWIDKGIWRCFPGLRAHTLIPLLTKRSLAWHSSLNAAALPKCSVGGKMVKKLHWYCWEQTVRWTGKVLPYSPCLFLPIDRGIHWPNKVIRNNWTRPWSWTNSLCISLESFLWICWFFSLLKHLQIKNTNGQGTNIKASSFLRQQSKDTVPETLHIWYTDSLRTHVGGHPSPIPFSKLG